MLSGHAERLLPRLLQQLEESRWREEQQQIQLTRLQTALRQDQRLSTVLPGTSTEAMAAELQRVRDEAAAEKSSLEAELQKLRDNQPVIIKPSSSVAPPSSQVSQDATNAEEASPSTKWTVAAWLASLRTEDNCAGLLVHTLTSRLLGRGTEDELTAMRQLWKAGGRDELHRRLRDTAGAPPLVDILVDAIAPHAKELVEAKLTDAQDMFSRFSQEGASLLHYAGLNTFFGGLEGVIGLPSPDVKATMKAEHTASADSKVDFETTNYYVTTTSETEWKFVVEPDECATWPKETRHIDVEARGRKLRSLEELKFKTDHLNDQLEKLSEPTLMIFEAFGAVLYTGPMFAKYNGVLRGLQVPFDPLVWERVEQQPAKSSGGVEVSNQGLATLLLQTTRLSPQELLSVQLSAAKLQPSSFVVDQASGAVFRPATSYLQRQLIKLCASDKVKQQLDAGTIFFDAVAKGANVVTAKTHVETNRYTTTLHVINSAIVKIGKLTRATKVYRGISGRGLPRQFWTANAFDVAGGVETAFMSTSTDRAVALGYAGGDDHSPGILIEVQQGMGELRRERPKHARKRGAYACVGSSRLVSQLIEELTSAP